MYMHMQDAGVPRLSTPPIRFALRLELELELEFKVEGGLGLSRDSVCCYYFLYPILSSPPQPSFVFCWRGCHRRLLIQKALGTLSFEAGVEAVTGPDAGEVVALFLGTSQIHCPSHEENAGTYWYLPYQNR